MEDRSHGVKCRSLFWDGVKSRRFKYGGVKSRGVKIRGVKSRGVKSCIRIPNGLAYTRLPSQHVFLIAATTGFF